VVYSLERVGKEMKMDKLQFPLPKNVSYRNKKEAAKAEAGHLCPEGWTHDNYFNSQDSFFDKDGEPWAQVIIRKWE
jgi:hypothetical protein